MATDFEEIKTILKNLAVSQQETDKKFQATEKLLKESSLETERLMKESSLETDKRFQETERIIKEQNKELNRRIGDLGDKFGYFTEGMALPTMELILETRFKVDTITPRFKKKLPNGKQLEYDVFGYCNGTVNNAVVVEIKSKLKYDHITEMVGELQEFKTNFPEYASKHLFGILVAVDVPSKDLIDHVKAKGLYFARIANDIFAMEENLAATDFNR